MQHSDVGTRLQLPEEQEGLRNNNMTLLSFLPLQKVILDHASKNIKMFMIKNIHVGLILNEKCLALSSVP